MKNLLKIICLVFYIVCTSTLADERDVQIAKMLENKTFALSINQTDGLSIGTAFYYGPDNLIVTNKHLVYKSKIGATVNLYVVNKYNNTTFTDNLIKAKILYLDSQSDIALLAITKKVPHSFLIRSKETLDKGNDIWQFGFSGGVDLMLSKGQISGFINDAAIHDGKAIVMNLTSSPGASGSPVVDKKGNLVGILTAIVEEKWSIAIPTKDIDSAIERYLGEEKSSNILFDGYTNISLISAKDKDKIDIYEEGLFYLIKNINTLDELFACNSEYWFHNFDQLPINTLDDLLPIIEMNLKINGHVSAHVFAMVTTTGEEFEEEKFLNKFMNFKSRMQDKIDSKIAKLKRNSTQKEFRRFGYQSTATIANLVEKSLDKAELLAEQRQSNIHNKLNKEEYIELIENISIAYELILSIDSRAPLDYIVRNLPTMKRNYMSKGVSLKDFNLLANGYRSLLKSKQRLASLIYILEE